MGMFTALASVFSTGEDVPSYSDIELNEEQRRTLESVEKSEKEVEKGFNSGNSSKSGIAPKINPDTEKAMRAMHSKVVKKEAQDREERE